MPGLLIVGSIAGLFRGKVIGIHISRDKNVGIVIVVVNLEPKWLYASFGKGDAKDFSASLLLKTVRVTVRLSRVWVCALSMKDVRSVV